VRISELIWVGSEAKYFCKRGLTRLLKIRSDLPVGHNQPDPVQANSRFPANGGVLHVASPVMHRRYGPRTNRP